MTLRVEESLDGSGQIRHLEAVHEGGTYRGFAVQVYEPGRAVWVRQYVNATRGRFSTLEGEAQGDRSTWRSVSPGRSRESKLVSEFIPPGFWKRTMSISDEGGKTWKVLWTDELERID